MYGLGVCWGMNGLRNRGFSRVGLAPSQNVYGFIGIVEGFKVRKTCFQTCRWYEVLGVCRMHCSKVLRGPPARGVRKHRQKPATNPCGHPTIQESIARTAFCSLLRIVQ